MTKLFTLFSFFLIHCNLFAQQQWISITATHEVVDVKEEGEYLWLATDGGVIRLNKATGEQELFTSTNSGLGDNRVQSIAIEENGKKWFATLNGVTSYDDSNWTVYINELPDNIVRSVAIDNQGNKWFGTQNSGCAMFDDSQWVRYNNQNLGHPTNITDIVVDSDNTIWFATFGRGITKLDNNQWTTYNSSNTALPSDYVFDLIVNIDKSIWFNLNTGVYKIDQGIVSMVSSDTPKCLAIDQTGTKWFGLRSGSICKYDDNGRNIYPYIPELSGKEVETIEVVNNGDFWIGTNDGIVYFDQSTSQHYKTATSGLPDALVYDIHIDNNGYKWFGTNHGAARFDGSDWINFTGKNSDFYLTQVLSITSDLDGNVWLATNSGLGKFDGQNMSMLDHTNSPLPFAIIRDVDVDPTNGDIWITSREGVLRFDGTNWTTFNTDNSQLPSNNVGSVEIDSDGVKWFGTGGSGIAKFDNSDWEILNTANSGVNIDNINAISIDKNQTKWIYTNMEVIEFDDISWNIHSHLGFGWRGEMHPGNENDKWFTGSNGMTKFTGTYYEHYTMENSGLPASWCRSFAIDEKGNKWIGTTGGVGIYNENGVDISSTPTSLNEMPAFSVEKVEISPNPVVSSFNIRFNFLPEQSKIKDLNVYIYDTYSNVKKQVSLPYSDQITLNVADLNSGIYFLKIRYGNNLGQVKFIKL